MPRIGSRVVSRLWLSIGCSLPTIGCAITLQHGPLAAAPEIAQRGSLAYQKVARGPGGSVGWGRGTLFGIPFVPIFIQGDDSYGGEMLMIEVRDALVAAGYDAAVVEPDAVAEHPVLECRFEARFNNYTWLFPIVPTWGSIELHADLVDASGEALLWSESFEGDGFTLNFFDGFDSAAKQSLTEVLDAMVLALTGEAFRVALASAAPPIVEAGEAGLAPVSAEPPALEGDGRE